MQDFLSVFSPTFMAIMKVFLVILAAGLLVRRNIITQQQIHSLTAVTVNVFLPCLMFSTVTRTFRPQEMLLWWILPIIALVMLAAGTALALLLFRKELPAKKNMLPLAVIQNAGYLILPVGQVLYPENFDTFATYCFLYILAFSPVLWTFGKYLMTSGESERLHWKTLLTPPFIANLLALVLVFTDSVWLVPSVVGESIHFLGQAAVPVANLILGAVLGSISLKNNSYGKDILKVISVKFFFMPLLTLLGVWISGLGQHDPLMAKFLILESAAAPATALVIQVRKYGGDEQKIGAIMLICYLVCIIMMPLWMSVWGILSS